MTSSARTGPGFTVREALIGVVLVGVLATAAIPRLLDAQYRSRDASAVADLHRLTDQIDSYARRHGGSLPESAREVGFAPSPGVRITLWKRQEVRGIPSLHVHIRHGGSPHQFHAHHPAEPSITSLPWEW